MRVTRGYLAGMTGRLVAADEGSRWLIQAESSSEGVFLRMATQALELV